MKPPDNTTFSGWMLLPPAKDKCQTCAVDHPPTWPHDAYSLFYQTLFNGTHGRAATWIDAMEHCDDATKEHWIRELKRSGIDVASGQVYMKETIQ